MNTTKKGDVLENNALGIIEKLIEDQRLGILKDCIRIYNKKDKKYPSKLKGRSDVEFDLTIEVWAPGAPKYSMIYIFECKNYKHRVPIGQIKKFHSDITETHGVNAKGILISSSPLEKGAFEFAEANDMMVIEGESKDNFKITLYKRTQKKDSLIPFISEKKDIKLLDEGTLSLIKLIDEKIISSLKKPSSNVAYNIDRLSKVDINQIALNELNNISPRIITSGLGLEKRN